MDRHIQLTYKNEILAFPGTSPVVIGQTRGCDVLIPNPTAYEDVIIAKIIPDSEGYGWHIVKSCRHYAVEVNGMPINRVHYLHDGDVIEILGLHLRFSIKEGAQTAPTVTHIHKGASKAIWGIITTFVLLLAFVGYQLYDNQRERITDAMKDEIAASIFTTRIDSLHLMYADSIADSYVYVSSPVGTAFLTTDSLIVTARHCLQPWLNTVLPADYGKIPEMSDWAVGKALFAETESQLYDDNQWRIVAFVTFTDESGNSLSLTTDDFAMNFEFDDIVELGSYANPQFWRSISHRYSRRDMMLGDIAVAKTDKAGNIAIADSADLQKLLPRRGVKLTFAGHPESGVNGNMLDFKTDELRLPLENMPECGGRTFLLAHEGGLTPGFSGGPVLVRDGAGFKAVGVVSVVDECNGSRCYSVPTSEIKPLIR